MQHITLSRLVKITLKESVTAITSPRRTFPDRDGHGTFTASLILNYAPDAELYVIKIADKENARPDAQIVANVRDPLILLPNTSFRS
jgi:hypothetical protein